MLVLISDFLGVPLDQLTFFVSQLIGILSSYLLKKYIPPCRQLTTWRHLTEIIVGTFVMYLCYQSHVLLLFWQAAMSYLIIIFLPPEIAQYAVLIFSMSFLSWMHMQRLLAYDDARQQSVDITAPLMVQTQKLSSIAFNLYDGVVLASDKELSKESHKSHAIRKHPKLLDFFGYLLCFQNSMVGPFLFFSDYLCFIEGREEDQVSDSVEREFVISHKEEIRSAKEVLKSQFTLFIFHFLLTLYAMGRYEPEYLISEEFQRLGIFRKYFWLSVYLFYLRQKFYCAWSISALSMLISGFGFSGFTTVNGILEPEYRNAINVRFFACELGTNTKETLDNWNIGTTRWLRECVYDRVPKRYGLVSAFFVSAFWHGLYPVYYICFLSTALVTMTGRLCRARLRPCFMGSYWYHRLYDIMTNMGGLFCLNYLGAGFLLLDTSLAFKLWGGFYYLGHIVPMIMLFLLPYVLPCVKCEPRRESVVGVSYELNLDPDSGAPLVTASTSEGKQSNPEKSGKGL
ncbi:hypothetical protein Aperf_G00000074600 [Anoplocephala perfoliata]